MKSLSIFVGSSQCNARCRHCAGVVHRKHAPNADGIIDVELIKRTLLDCHHQGARSLSISSSGEPTLSPRSVTRVLTLVNTLKLKFEPVNLYSNGIRIGADEYFSDYYLPLWKVLGLSRIYVTVHSVNEIENATRYGVRMYPPLKTVVDKIHEHKLQVRANIVLTTEGIGTLESFQNAVTTLLYNLNVDSISAWPIRTLDDVVDVDRAPSSKVLTDIDLWIGYEKIWRPKMENVRLLREKDKCVYERNEKLTLFPDGTLSNKWCS